MRANLQQLSVQYVWAAYLFYCPLITRTEKQANRSRSETPVLSAAFDRREMMLLWDPRSVLFAHGSTSTTKQQRYTKHMARYDNLTHFWPNFVYFIFFLAWS